MHTTHSEGVAGNHNTIYLSLLYSFTFIWCNDYTLGVMRTLPTLDGVSYISILGYKW